MYTNVNLTSRTFDFIIAGGGIAGFSLAYHLINSPLRDCSILVVDKDLTIRNDRTLSFWADRPTLFDAIVYHTWNQVRFVGEEFERTVDLNSFRYKMIRGADFFHFVHQALTTCPNVVLLQGTIERIDDGDDGASIVVNGHTYKGKWVFDSLFNFAHFQPDSSRYSYLCQSFKGWEIETVEPVFDPQTATLMDFRTPQKQDMRFFYVLPVSEHRALVEYVLLERDNCNQALRNYIENVLGIKQYQIVYREGGVTPLSDRPFRRQIGQHIMTIGIQGGRAKPSSGYVFSRIQADSAAIVQSLLTAGHPFDISSTPLPYRLCDSMMLQIMARHGERIKPLFTFLFKRNPVERIFKFLDEVTSLWEVFLLGASLVFPVMSARFVPSGAPASGLKPALRQSSH